MTEAYPLQWPDGWKRTPPANQARSRYQVTPERATRELMGSLLLLGAQRGSIVISTNIPVRKDGLPFANYRAPDDAGVAVYWTTNGNAERVMACDRWYRVHENIRAIGLAVDGLRAIDRAGASQIMERAYSAFGALPPSQAAPVVRPWWEVFGFPESLLGALSLPVAEARFRELAKRHHPDTGGTDAAIIELTRALDQARFHYKG